MSDEIELTVVMPCLNEAETIERCIRKAQGWFAESGTKGEVVIGDNGSTDGSQDIARRLGARVVDVPVRGYGAALDGAIRAARGRFVVMGDSDDSYDFSKLTPFLEKLREGYDLVMGNRFRGGIHPGAMPFKNRYLGNPVLSGIGRLFFRSPAGDFHCGIRGFSVDAFRRMDLRTTGMEFASEMVIKATLGGMRITEVPTELHKDGRNRPPHLRPWRDGWRHLRFMLLYSPNWLFLYPGLVLLAVGAALGVWLWPGPRVVGPVGLDVHTLVYAAFMVLVGFQATLMAVFARAYAVKAGLRTDAGWFARVWRRVALEGGIIAGIALMLLGLGGAAFAIRAWQAAGFGALQPGDVLRVVVPSGLLLTLGAEVLFGSFLLGVLDLDVRSDVPPSVARPSAP
ncbi:MAG: glycosyltransferase family 2 protein [Polyangiales bacterium]